MTEQIQKNQGGLEDLVLLSQLPEATTQSTQLAIGYKPENNDEV